ncbi:FecCD family ABC transporter permease [Tepidimonas alkaliphilus]|nr:iron ABC transporter permease [Tepidimonas alkaliphilus]
MNVRRVPGPLLMATLLLAMAAALLWSATQGAYPVSWQRWPQWWQAWRDSSAWPQDAMVFGTLRLPRLLLGALVGAGLGLAGALMQGLFRNPLADPGLIGVSSGAALAAGVAIVALGQWWPEAPRLLGSWTLMVAAALGGWLATLLVVALARGEHGVRVGVMLLAGVAVNALAGAGIGLLGYVATDEQLRQYQMWMLGSLGGARWSVVAVMAVVVGCACAIGLALARPLDVLALGEAQAVLMGVPLARLKAGCVAVAAVVTGAVTASVGMIGFVGLVAPHCVRLLAGPLHRWVIPGSAALGAVLVLVADAAARTWRSPAELPLGVLTALLGVPFLIGLLRRARRSL